MVAFVDSGLPFGSLVFHHQFLICLFKSLSVLSAGFSPPFWSCSSASDLADAGRVIHRFPEGFLGLFDSSWFASFSKVFVAGFSITCPVRFLEVDADSPRPINRGQYGVGGDEDWQMIGGQ